jgi:hypothetical protein
VSRRRVRAGAALVISGLVAACASTGPDAASSGRIADLGRAYGVAIVAGGVAEALRSLPEAAAGGLRGADAGREALARAAAMLQREVAKYPRDAFRCIGASRIVLVRELVAGGERRPAFPAYDGGALVLDVEYPTLGERELARVFHHEAFHLFDRRDDGELEGDAVWTRQNPLGFRYGGGGAPVARFADWLVPSDRVPGAVTAYAELGVAEDKAEVFSLLFAEPQVLVQRAGEDGIVFDKLTRLGEILRSGCPSFDGAYWAQRRVGEAASPTR